MNDDWFRGYCSVGDIRLHCLRTGGANPPLLIAHGLYDDGPCRTPLVRELQDSYDVVAFDARGHGRSDAPESGYAVEDRVDDLLGVLDSLDIERPILWGHSMGGHTAAVTAATAPERVRALVLVDPAGMLEFDEPSSERRAAAVRDQIRTWSTQTKADILKTDEGIASCVDAGEAELASLLADARSRLHPNAVAISREGYRDPRTFYGDIEAPTLLLRADVDSERRTCDHEIASLLERGQLVHVEGAGHTVFRDARSEATSQLWQFLQDLDG